ncbi:MAG: MFS transporter [Paenibacillaceae bacterium]
MRFALFLSSLLFYSFATNATRPIVSLYAADTLHASPFFIGILVSAYALFPMLFAMSIGKLLDRYGARVVAILGGCGMLLSLLTPVFQPSLISILFSQLFAGFCNICLIISYQKTVGNRVGDRDNNVMWLTLIFSFAEFLGPLMSGFTYQFLGFRWTLIISALSVLLGIIIGSVISKDHWKGGVAEYKSKKTNFMESLGLLKSANVRKVLLLSAVILYTKDLLVAYFPVYGNSIGLSASMIGLILSCASEWRSLFDFVNLG